MIRYDFERSVASRPVWGEVRIPDAPPARTAIVTVHGFKGFKDWGFWPYVCDRLAAAGHAVVSFNFSASGVRPGDSDVADADAFAKSTVSVQLDELAALLDAVHGDLLPRPPRSVGVMGHSGGGGVAILAAAARERVAAMVTWSAVSTFNRWGGETQRAWRDEGRLYVMNRRTGRQLTLSTDLLDDLEANRERLDVLTHARRVSAPWLIVHGSEDLTVRLEEGRALARAASNAWLVAIEGGEHDFGAPHPWTGPPSPQLSEALDATLRHFGRHLGTER